MSLRRHVGALSLGVLNAGKQVMPKIEVELQDGIWVQVETSEPQLRRIVDKGAEKRLESGIEMIRPILLKACAPVIDVWKELNREMAIGQAQIELGIGFSAEGNVFIASGKATANLTVRLTLDPVLGPGGASDSGNAEKEASQVPHKP
jgi:hypothetical protein